MPADRCLVWANTINFFSISTLTSFHIDIGCICNVMMAQYKAPSVCNKNTHINNSWNTY